MEAADLFDVNGLRRNVRWSTSPDRLPTLVPGPGMTHDEQVAIGAEIDRIGAEKFDPLTNLEMMCIRRHLIEAEEFNAVLAMRLTPQVSPDIQY